MSLAKLDVLLQELSNVYETDEALARTYGEEVVGDRNLIPLGP